MTEIPKEKVTRTEMISFHTQSQFMARVLFDVFNLPQSQSHLMGDLKKDERASTIVYTNSWFEAYETSQTAQKLSNTLVFSGNDFDNLLSCSGLIHGELDAPAYFIATALYEAYSGKTKADQKIFLDTLYPTSGQNGETGGLPKLNTLLALAGAVDKASLNQLFTNTADSLFPASQSPVRQTFGLVIPTASEIERYGH